jgi:hypothetical protein
LLQVYVCVSTIYILSVIFELLLVKILSEYKINNTRQTTRGKQHEDKQHGANNTGQTTQGKQHGANNTGQTTQAKQHRANNTGREGS